MTAEKHIAAGTIIKIDYGTGFATIDQVRSYQGPGRGRAEIDALTLDDTLEVPLSGIEEKSEASFKQAWHPGDFGHENIDTAFGAKTEIDVQRITPHDTPVTDEFTGEVIRLTETELNPQGIYEREVTLRRKSAITRT